MATMPREECARRLETRPRSEWLLHGPGPARTLPNTRLRCDHSTPLASSPGILKASIVTMNTPDPDDRHRAEQG
jgi:hypothetical protein